MLNSIQTPYFIHGLKWPCMSYVSQNLFSFLNGALVLLLCMKQAVLAPPPLRQVSSDWLKPINRKV